MNTSRRAAVRAFEDITVGQRAQFEVVLTPELVDAFAEVSGDMNPLHTEEAYAQSTPFKGRVAHGMLAGAFFSRLIGMCLPGKHSVYLSQSLFFRKPMRIGAEVLVSGEVLHKGESLHTLSMHMRVAEKQSGDVLADGEAIVKIL